MADTHSLDFSLDLSELEREPKTFDLQATDSQRAAIAERFGLLALASLSGSVSVHDGGAETGVMVRGTIKASLTQRCIASLEPVDELLDTKFELMLVDPEMADRMDEEGVYLDENAAEYDALEGDSIPLGEILAQTLSISMNPYPRAEGAEVTSPKKGGVTINEPALERPNPFAVLAKTRDES